MTEESTQPPDMHRHHQNNLEHVRKVYLSVLFSVPKEYVVSELAKLTESIKRHLEKETP